MLADFQQLEVDYCAGKPDSELAVASQRGLQTVPILRMYGITAAGNSVCTFLHGFEPYFFCKGSNARYQLSPDDMPVFQEALNVCVPTLRV
jgi:DNA polymerase delta subunit 1